MYFFPSLILPFAQTPPNFTRRCSVRPTSRKILKRISGGTLSINVDGGGEVVAVTIFAGGPSLRGRLGAAGIRSSVLSEKIIGLAGCRAVRARFKSDKGLK